MEQQVAVARLLVEAGWVTGYAQLREVASRATIDRMLAGGDLVRIARGRYAAPAEIPARLAAERVGGVAAYRTAAAHYGWAMKWRPARPCVTVPRGRVVGSRGEGLELSWRALPAEEVDEWITTPVRTVLDCAATLPFDAALCIADSALRARAVTPAQLRARAATGRCGGEHGCSGWPGMRTGAAPDRSNHSCAPAVWTFPDSRWCRR